MRTCEWCGVRFTRPHDKGPAPRYCSPGHRQRAYEARRVARLVAIGLRRLDRAIADAKERAE